MLSGPAHLRGGGGPNSPHHSRGYPRCSVAANNVSSVYGFLSNFLLFHFYHRWKVTENRSEVTCSLFFIFFSQLDEMTLAPLHAHPGSLRFPSICFLRHSILIKMADFFSGVQGKTTLYSHVCSVPSAAWGIFHSVMFSASM